MIAVPIAPSSSVKLAVDALSFACTVTIRLPYHTESKTSVPVPLVVVPVTHIHVAYAVRGVR